MKLWPQWSQPMWLGLGLVALTFAGLHGVLACSFVNYDDPDYITGNRMVVNALSAESIYAAFAYAHAGHWHPLTWLSFQVDWWLFEEDAVAFHTSALLLHALNVVLLYTWLGRATGAWTRSAACAGLFAVHPLHVESVAWLSERKDLLSGCFGLLALHAYTGYVRAPGWRRYVGVVLACVACWLSKAMLVTLPCLLLVLEVWPLRRTVGWGWRVIEKLPLLLLAGGVVWIAARAQADEGAVKSLADYPLAVRAGNALHATAWYVWKTVWPTNLAVMYAYPRAGQPLPDLLAAVLTLGGVTAYARWAAWRGRPMALVGWLWYLGTLAPVCGLIQIGSSARSDHYTYWPLIGIGLAIVWELPAWWPGWRGWRWLALAGLLVCAGWSAYQVQFWQTSARLWDRALTVGGPSPLAHLGWSFHAADGEAHLHAALALDPRFAPAHFVLARRYFAANDLASARGHYCTAAELWPQMPRFALGYAQCLERMGDLVAAETEYRRGEELQRQRRRR